jgi:hypothetical protein
VSTAELTTLRDHCRTMAAAPTEIRRPRGSSGACMGLGNVQRIHEDCVWGWQSCACTCHDDERPQPPTDAERALWTLLADEIDAWLTGRLEETRPDEHTEPPLWEEAL